MDVEFIVEDIEFNDQFEILDDSVGSLASEKDNAIEKSSDDILLQKFLESIEMEFVYGYLKAAHVTYKSLQFLKETDLKEALPPLGLRAEFREKLLKWKKIVMGVEVDDDMSVPSNVGESLIRKNSGRILPKDFKSLLNDSLKGRLLLDYANRNSTLMKAHRDDIINIITEDILCRNITLCSQDFNRLLEEICLVFPAELNTKDYYYIPRKGKNNASGKLYSKYRNKKVKKKRLLDSLPNTSADEVEENVEIDESIAVALKSSLIRDCANWESVCEKWKRTYHMRQKDLKKFNSHDFLQEWPKLSESRAVDLIKIDFDIMYPTKGHLLLSKWDKFEGTVRNFYTINIHNEYCKHLIASASSTSNIDSQDYIYTILLNAVLPSHARFKCAVGNSMKRATIMDSQENLVLRLTTIHDYKRQIDSIIGKFYYAGLTVHPLLIVEDDFQINNPLGSHTFSICGCYINFPSMPQHLLSKLEYILPAAFISSTDLKIHGNEKSFYHLVEELRRLEDGIDIDMGGEMRRIHFVLGLVVGDNLAVNSILGFVQSFNCKRYCRVCTRTKLQMQTYATEYIDFLRNEQSYQQDLIGNDFKETGVKNSCVFESIPNFHVTENFCFDIMHDVYEGVRAYDVCNVIMSLINDKIITLKSINNRKKLFPFGELEIGNNSVPLIYNRIKKFNLKMTASETICFINFLPLMIGDLIPIDNPH